MVWINDNPSDDVFKDFMAGVGEGGLLGYACRIALCARDASPDSVIGSLNENEFKEGDEFAAGLGD